MSSRTARRLAWLLVGLYVVLSTIGLSLQYLSRTYLRDFGLSALISITVVAMFLYVLAAMIVWHHPRNPIGWLWCALVMVWGIDLFSFGYAYYGLIAHPGSLPGANLMLVWQAWTGGSFVIPGATLLALLFPNGRPLSPRWGRVGWIVVGAIAAYLFVDAREPGPLEVFPFLPNPLGVSASLWATLKPIREAALTIALLSLLAAVFSLILRLRRANGDEQLQLKWMMFPVVYFAVTLVFVFFAGLESDDALLSLANGLHSLSPLGLFVATAIAIFKYRLYDIDVIINRTLVYGVLSGLLAAVYFASVAILQNLLRALSGQKSPIAIVVATLLVYALFQPLRRRVQVLIDRRFYRRKYDADRTRARFGSSLQDQFDADGVMVALLDVVEESVQPEHSAVWLRTRAESI